MTLARDARSNIVPPPQTVISSVEHRRMSVPKASKTVPKKRPVPTKRSPLIRAVDTAAAPHSGRVDDVKIAALNLAPGKLSAQMKAYLKKCDEKLRFVRNLLQAFNFDDANLTPFVD